MPELAVKTHPIHQRCERSRLGAVMSLASPMSRAHQASMFEDAQMFRYGRLRDARVVSQHPHGLFTVTAEALENRAARGIGQRSEDRGRRFACGNR